MKIRSHSLAETEAFAAQFLKFLKTDSAHRQAGSVCVVGLYGDLGSGKTAFTQAFAKLLGIQEVVTSPTYVIEKMYPINSLLTAFKHLIHIDAYRIETSTELVALGWDKLITDPGNLIIVEWPEKIEDIMPTNHIRLQFTFVDETTRDIEMIGSDEVNK